MSGHAWFILALIVLPLAGFSLWLLGQFLKSRHEETEIVVREGLTAEAEIVGVSGNTVSYRFKASGWKHPITVSKRIADAHRFTAGEKVGIRYLPGHPYISVIVSGNP